MCTLGQLCARMLTLPSRSTGKCCWPTCVSDGMACHCTTSPPHRSGSKSGCSKLREWRPCCTGVTLSPTVAHLAILRKTHHRLLLRCIGWKRKHGDGYHVLSYVDALAKTDCENVETTVRKRRILFAGFVARMGNERLPKRVSDVWGTGGGKGYLVSGRARTGLDGLSRTRPTYHCLTCPPKRNNGCWQLRTRASGSDVLRKRQVVHI